ncbi:MAG: hypothetical protein ACYDG6_12565 [Thermincolia bacterium]
MEVKIPLGRAEDLLSYDKSYIALGKESVPNWFSGPLRIWNWRTDCLLPRADFLCS